MRKKDLFDKLVLECKGLRSDAILARALSLAPSGDIETITYLHEILKKRTRKKFANQLERGLKPFDLEPIPFLLQARDIAKNFKKKASGKDNVYVILLENFKKVRFGLYVGRTSRYPEERLIIHKEGPSDKRKTQHAKCYKSMSKLLPSLFEHLNPMSRKDSESIEKELADAYRDVNIKVDGGDKVKYKEKLAERAKAAEIIKSS